MMKVEMIMFNDIQVFEDAVNKFLEVHDVIDVQYRPIAVTKSVIGSSGLTMTMVKHYAMITYVDKGESHD